MRFDEGWDNLSNTEIQRALGVLEDAEGGGGKRVGEKSEKIKIEPDRLDGVGINQTISITIELPAYYVAGMQALGGENRDARYREAVRDYLLKKGQTWWQPRFLAAVRAKEIEAFYRFTKRRR